MQPLSSPFPRKRSATGSAVAAMRVCVCVCQLLSQGTLYRNAGGTGGADETSANKDARESPVIQFKMSNCVPAFLISGSGCDVLNLQAVTLLSSKVLMRRCQNNTVTVDFFAFPFPQPRSKGLLAVTQELPS